MHGLRWTVCCVLTGATRLAALRQFMKFSNLFTENISDFLVMRVQPKFFFPPSKYGVKKKKMRGGEQETPVTIHSCSSQH